MLVEGQEFAKNGKAQKAVPLISKTALTLSLCLSVRSVSDDRYPNSVLSPSGALFHSTTGGTVPSNAGVQRSDRDAGLRLRGCVRRYCGWLCPVVPQPFRQHADNVSGHRHEPAGLP